MASGIRAEVLKFCILSFGFSLCLFLCFTFPGFAQDIKQPNVAGSFYPDDREELSQMIDGFLEGADPVPLDEDIFALISPHAGYNFSGQVAAYSYKLAKDKPYKTVVVIGVSHYYGFNGVSVYPEGVFRTPLGDLKIDKEFTKKLLYKKDSGIFFEPRAFEREHSVETQLPFLQKALSGFKIVPVVMGECSFGACQELAGLLKEAIGKRKDVLVVASSDMYHGYDYDEAEAVDNLTLAYLRNMDAQGLYDGLKDASLQLCGGLPVVSTLILAKALGCDKLTVLRHTNSAEVTGKRAKGAWTVGYASCVIGRKGGGAVMFNKEQRKKLLKIARDSIEAYLRSAKKLQLTERDPLLLKEMGAFVTLHKHGQLRGCIGSLTGQSPLYLTVRDMAVEAAVDDPRFLPLTIEELKDTEIEISALSPLEKIGSIDEIKLGIHGVIIRQGPHSGVFLPQVATETGWSKEEFLSNLCAHKAGLPPDAWKDKAAEIYIFSAEVFSEENY